MPYLGSPEFLRRKTFQVVKESGELDKAVLLRTRATQAMTETTVLDFKLSNIEEYRAHMNAPEQQAMFAEMGVKTFFIGVCQRRPSKSDSDVSRTSRTSSTTSSR